MTGHTIQEFIERLSSKAPVPGGGGASALVGSIGTSLCAMVANLTSGKAKYLQYQEDIDDILKRLDVVIPRLLSLIEKDAEVFFPLSEAYGMPKDDPERDKKLEEALVNASSVPFEILEEISGALDVVEELSVKGSKLAISDIAVAASLCKAAMEGAAMNVYINTKLMNQREYATMLNEKTARILSEGAKRCDAIYMKISNELRGTSEWT